MIIVATTSLPAVDRPNAERPNADRWNAARSCQKTFSWTCDGDFCNPGFRGSRIFASLTAVELDIDLKENIVHDFHQRKQTCPNAYLQHIVK